MFVVEYFHRSTKYDHVKSNLIHMLYWKTLDRFHWNNSRKLFLTQNIKRHSQNERQLVFPNKGGNDWLYYSVSPNPFVIELQTWWIHACGVEISFLLSWLVEVLLLQQEIGVTIDLVVHRYYENVLETSECFTKEVKTTHD